MLGDLSRVLGREQAQQRRRNVFKRKVYIFGRAIPVSVILALVVTVVAVAGFLTYVMQADVTITVPDAYGPVVNSGFTGLPEPSCTVVADPEGLGATCAITAVADNEHHSLVIDNAGPGAQFDIVVRLANLDDDTNLYGQVVDVASLPPEVTYSEAVGDPGRFCGKLAPWFQSTADVFTTGYTLTIDGSLTPGQVIAPFTIELPWDSVDPGGACPSSY